jgi:hypothetical protein
MLFCYRKFLTSDRAAIYKALLRSKDLQEQFETETSFVIQ